MAGMQHPLYIYIVSARVHTPYLGPVISFSSCFMWSFLNDGVFPRPMISGFT